MKRRLLSTVLAFCMMLALLPGTALAADNECGLNATWTLSNGTLTISGSGRMTDYQGSDVPWYNQRQEVTRVVIGSGITSIGDCAFSYCVNLASVTLPNSLTSVGMSSFSYCEQLTSIALPSQVKSIGGGAFYACSKLTKISIPAGVSAIESGTFNRCSNLKTISYAGTEAQWNKIWIHDSNYQYLFSATAKLNYAGSPNTQTMFSGNLGGSSNTAGSKIIWTLGKDGILTISGAGAMPDSTRPWRYRGSDIADIRIGSNISRIGQAAFSGFSALSSITIPGTVSSVGRSAFDSCSNLSEVTILEGVTSLDSYAFNSCSSLMSVTIPSSMLIISDYAFYSCNRLTDIYYAGTKAEWEDMQIGADAIPKNCEIHYESGTPTPPAPESYTVTFNANGGSVTPDAKVYEEGSTFGELPTLTRTGYTFNGWYTAKTSGTKITGDMEVTADMTLYARWTKNAVKTYTITLNANGGKVTPASIKVESGKTYLDQLPTPTREGYYFDGWYTTKTGATKITAATKATANRTIYAHWTEKEEDANATVKFIANGGTVYQRSKTVLRGSRYRDLPTPTRPGYHFLGWYTKPTGGTKVTSTTRVTAAGDHTLYARWTKTAPKAQTTRTGSWTVYIPPYYKLPLYLTQTTAVQSKVNPATGSEYAVKCTKMVQLSNGTVRYYGNAGGVNRWFQFTCEMDID